MVESVAVAAEIAELIVRQVRSDTCKDSINFNKIVICEKY